MRLWALVCIVAAAAAPTPPPCVTTRPASKSERYLIFASGHVRSLAATAETAIAENEKDRLRWETAARAK